MNDKDFQRLVSEWMRKQVYDQVRAQPPDDLTISISEQRT